MGKGSYHCTKICCGSWLLLFIKNFMVKVKERQSVSTMGKLSRECAPQCSEAVQVSSTDDMALTQNIYIRIGGHNAGIIIVSFFIVLQGHCYLHLKLVQPNLLYKL